MAIPERIHISDLRLVGLGDDMRTVKYQMPINGLGTESSQDDQPLEFAPVFTNRFRNLYGKAEK